ncbi:hypothetical protein FF1_001890 [Malus domestica]
MATLAFAVLVVAQVPVNPRKIPGIAHGIISSNSAHDPQKYHILRISSWYCSCSQEWRDGSTGKCSYAHFQPFYGG